MKALIAAWQLDGAGGGVKLVDLEACRKADPDAPLWMHVIRSEEEAPHFLQCMPGTPDVVQKALFAEDTRPRCDLYSSGVLLNLRAVNVNPAADPTELLAVRIWATDKRMISLRRHKIGAVEQIRKEVAKGIGPQSIAQIIVSLSERLADEMAGRLELLEDRFEVLEDDESALNADNVAELRKEVVAYRRFIDPQLAAITKLANTQLSWFSEVDRNGLRHVADMVARQREQLEALRERASILRDTHASMQADKMNKTVYFLTIVAALFLPLGFVTGLLGINVGGIPGADMASAFWWVVLGMVIFALLEVAIFKIKKWI